jgi:hypothetical protein
VELGGGHGAIAVIVDLILNSYATGSRFEDVSTPRHEQSVERTGLGKCSGGTLQVDRDMTAGCSPSVL